MQFGVNKYLYLFQRPQIALAVQAWGILVSLKNLLMLIETKMQSQSCYYPAKLNSFASKWLGGKVYVLKLGQCVESQGG